MWFSSQEDVPRYARQNDGFGPTPAVLHRHGYNPRGQQTIQVKRSRSKCAKLDRDPRETKTELKRENLKPWNEYGRDCSVTPAVIAKTDPLDLFYFLCFLFFVFFLTRSHI